VSLRFFPFNKTRRAGPAHDLVRGQGRHAKPVARHLRAQAFISADTRGTALVFLPKTLIKLLANYYLILIKTP
jgi:hypothetical protein